MNKDYSLFDMSKVTFEYVGEPVNKNKDRNQIEIITSDIYVRTSPSINSKIIGYINLGTYDYLEIQKSDGYSWYFIDIGWVPYGEEWAIIHKEKKKIQEYKIKEKNNISIKIFRLFINFIKKIFKRT